MGSKTLSVDRETVADALHWNIIKWVRISYLMCSENRILSYAHNHLCVPHPTRASDLCWTCRCAYPSAKRELHCISWCLSCCFVTVAPSPFPPWDRLLYCSNRHQKLVEGWQGLHVIGWEVTCSLSKKRCEQKRERWTTHVSLAQQIIQKCKGS